MKHKISFLLILLFHTYNTFGCDTTPSLSAGNVLDNGNGTYYMDISACIGSGGSADGFDLYFDEDINIVGTTVTEVTAPGTGNTATVSVVDGVWIANFDEYSEITNTPFFENNFTGANCIDFGIIVDQNPEGATINSLGINETCLGFTPETEFEYITTGSVPGSCVPNYSVIDSGIIDAGMIPKVQACLETVRAGVAKAHIIDGRLRHSLLLEVYTNQGVGTQILRDSA